GGNLATKEVADDFAYMGIDLVSRANNKQTDYASVWEDFQQVERVGIIHAGVARTLPEARMPRNFATPKGLVGFVGLTSDGGTDACCAGGQVVSVTAEQLAQVKAMKDALLARRDEVEIPVELPAPDPEGTVNVFGVTFRQGANSSGAQAAETTGRGGRGGGAGRNGPGNWVKNTVKLTLFHGVTAEQMKQLRAIAGDSGTGTDLHAFGTQFRLMDRPGEHSFDMDPQDLKEMLTQIRSGKQGADFLATNFHWHQNRYDFQAYSHDHFPADFEIKFAHMAIDQGDDMFAAQGVHTIKGVEIYKGKPIFYGLSNFIFQAGIMARAKGSQLFVPPGSPVAADQSAAAPQGRAGGRGAGDADQPAAGRGRGGRGGRGAPAPAGDEIVGEYQYGGSWQNLANMESLVGESHYENGQLTEVRVYPVDLGQTPRPMSQLGIPRRPTPAVATKILNELIEYSKPFNTKIVIENGVAVIRIPPSERH
ncbi:MAG TPA: CapA family protein, partial [Thermomicrobiales bacterium]|nr:CapA family protein [Thermomicrobiales bacterium]